MLTYGGPADLYRNFDRPLLQLQKLLQIADQPLRPEPAVHRAGRARQLRVEEIDDLVARYQAGESMAQLAKDLNLHRSTISGRLRDRQVELHQPGPQMTEQQIEEALELYASGDSCVRIGKQLGFHQATIYNQLKRRGVALRSPHDRRLH